MRLNSVLCLFCGALASVGLFTVSLAGNSNGSKLAGAIQMNAGALTGESINQDVEVGQVNWSRDWEAAKVKSKATGKPIFLQFQEVPG